MCGRRHMWGSPKAYYVVKNYTAKKQIQKSTEVDSVTGDGVEREASTIM